ncbi:hypothetical protein AACH06_23685 [Ideonella sp. DXS29W]|uniref:DUF3455 domain-containing protein n=1 Tax=Ideonella lacteola TaxID=2984193 RepID=A0ABU9BV41_9BURK
MSIVWRGAATWARTVVSLAALWAAHGAMAALPLYRISVVPTEGDLASAEAINDQGVIVGTLHGDKARAFRWREGRAVEWAPLDDPRREQFAVSVDEQGAMSYWVQWPGNVWPGKFLRTEVWAKGTTPAKKLRGVFSYFGNTAGDLIVDGQERTYALRERDGTVTELGLADDKVELNDLNNRQQVVGHRKSGRPVMWTRGAGFTDIPALPDEPQVSARAVNDRAEVALMTGPFDLSLNGPDNAPNAIYLWSVGNGVQSLGSSADCAWYQPIKLGAHGTVVGQCYAQPSPVSAQHAFAADATHGVYLLESCVDPADPQAGRYDIWKAVGINQSGQIAAEAYDRVQRVQKVILLTPVR